MFILRKRGPTSSHTSPGRDRRHGAHLAVLRLLRFCVLVLALQAAPVPASAQFAGQVLDQAYLNVPFDRQETIVWCWVASARMVARYFNLSTPSQCQMLQAQYGAPCCSRPDLCARPGHIAEIQGLIGSFGLRYSSIAPRVDGFTLLNIFKSGRPVVMHVDNSHFVVATGMRVVQSPMGPLGIVRINDPFRGTYEQDLPTLYNRWDIALYVY